MSATGAIIEPRARRPRQLRLFPVTNPLSEHLGDAFFRALPRRPGVYFFYDEAGRLLYIGQSNNLRARVGSYRHVCFERHARRTLRLVHRVRRIEWEICESMQCAIERERELLLERRPPFNRAGVWQAPPWWLHMEMREDAILLLLKREAASPGDGTDETRGTDAVRTAGLRFGPYGASFPFVYAALVRAALRLCRPGICVADFPAGYLQSRFVAEVQICSGAATIALAEWLTALLAGKDTAFNSSALFAGVGNVFENKLWEADAELLTDFRSGFSPCP